MNKQTTVTCAGTIVSLIMIFLGTMPGCQNAETSVRYTEGFVQADDDLELYYRMRGDYCSPPLPPEARASSRLVNILTMRSIENWNWLDDFHETDIPVLVLQGNSD